VINQHRYSSHQEKLCCLEWDMGVRTFRSTKTALMLGSDLNILSENSNIDIKEETHKESAWLFQPAKKNFVG